MMLLIYNSNGKLEKVKAEVGDAAERRSLLELESLSDSKLDCIAVPLFTNSETAATTPQKLRRGHCQNRI